MTPSFTAVTARHGRVGVRVEPAPPRSQLGHTALVAIPGIPIRVITTIVGHIPQHDMRWLLVVSTILWNMSRVPHRPRRRGGGKVCVWGGDRIDRIDRPRYRKLRLMPNHEFLKIQETLASLGGPRHTPAICTRKR